MAAAIIQFITSLNRTTPLHTLYKHVSCSVFGELLLSCSVQTAFVAECSITGPGVGESVVFSVSSGEEVSDNRVITPRNSGIITLSCVDQVTGDEQTFSVDRRINIVAPFING